MSIALWTGAAVQGLIYGFLALGVYLSYRVLRFADITVDGSFTTGAAVAAVLLAQGAPPIQATILAMCAAGLAGVVTGLLNTGFKLNDLLSGILVMTGLYSVNLHVMNGANVSLNNATTLINWFRERGFPVGEDYVPLAFLSALAVIVVIFITWYLKTDFGIAMRAVGDNEQMITAQGVNTSAMKVAGLAVSNAIVGLSGGLLAQEQGFVDINMGIGSLVAGIAAVMIGQTFFARKGLLAIVAGVVVGSIVFRIVVALALHIGLNPMNLRILTAVFVVIALVLPTMMRKLQQRKVKPA